jgi:hypothetical protein
MRRKNGRRRVTHDGIGGLSADERYFNRWPLPKMGHDFPRHFIDETPEEILFDAERIFARGVTVTRTTDGETVLNQPRIESTGYQQTMEVNDCPPPSQVPYIKRQIHLDLSRDAETLLVTCNSDVQAQSILTIVAFETFATLRTILRWIDFKVYDALDPSAITLQVLIDCQPVKYYANPNVTCAGGSGCPSYTGSTIQNPTALDIQNAPDDFHNVLLEITDRHQVEIVIVNTTNVDRKVSATVWGWIESITVWDEAVRR